jgi:hypothetical protein
MGEGSRSTAGAASMVREALIRLKMVRCSRSGSPVADARAMRRQAAPGSSCRRAPGCGCRFATEKLAGRAEGADRSQYRRSVLHGAAGIGERDSGRDIRWRNVGRLGARWPSAASIDGAPDFDWPL